MAKYSEADQDIARRNLRQWGREQEAAAARGDQAAVERLDKQARQEGQKLPSWERFRRGL